MAQYHKELTKWMFILLDKLFLEQSFADPIRKLSADQIYPLLSITGETSEADFLRLHKRPRAKTIQLLKEYLKLGLIEKVPDETDARKRKLRLTASGQEYQNQIKDLIDQEISFLLGDMSVNEEIAVLKFISRINQLTVGKYEPKGQTNTIKKWNETS